MAPEQGALEKVDRRADIFAVGVLVWEASRTGVSFPRAPTPWASFVGASRARPALEEVMPEAPPELVAICRRAMARRPEDRYQTALELRQALDTYLASASRPTDEDIGGLVSNAFELERAAMRAKVEEQLRAPTNPPPGVFSRTTRSHSRPRPKRRAWLSTVRQKPKRAIRGRAGSSWAGRSSGDHRRGRGAVDARARRRRLGAGAVGDCGCSAASGAR